MSLSILNNFETLNSYFNDIFFLINNANKDLIWEGKARENFDKNTQSLKNTFTELMHENEELSYEYSNLVSNVNSLMR